MDVIELSTSPHFLKKSKKIPDIYRGNNTKSRGTWPCQHLPLGKFFTAENLLNLFGWSVGNGVQSRTGKSRGADSALPFSVFLFILVPFGILKG